MARAENGDPFALLGAHRNRDGRWWIRAFFPGAHAAAVVAAGLAADDAPELWNEAINVYTSARQLLRTGTLADALDSYACRTLRRPFAALGRQENSGEPDNTRSALTCSNCLRSKPNKVDSTSLLADSVT